MPIENDFTRVFNAIKELEARVERMEQSVWSGGETVSKFDWQPQEPDYKALFESEQRERRIDAECRLLTLKSLEQTSSENNQLRFILSILAAVKDDGWIEWHGGECPVAVKRIIDIKYRCGNVRRCDHPALLTWHNDGNPYDIIAYRIAR